MFHFLLTGVVVAVALFAASKLLSGVKVKRNGALVMMALVFGVLNVFVGWLVKLLIAIALFPVALVTLGLPYLFLGLLANMAMLWLADKLVDDVEFKGFGSLFGTAVLVSVVGWLVGFTARA